MYIYLYIYIYIPLYMSIYLHTHLFVGLLFLFWGRGGSGLRAVIRTAPKHGREGALGVGLTDMILDIPLVNGTPPNVPLLRALWSLLNGIGVC